MKIETLQSALHSSWSAETCYPTYKSRWTQEKPYEHQCAVTALAVWYFCGGQILERKHKNGRAFYNRLPDGQIVDLSLQDCHTADGPERVRQPKQLLRGHTQARFEILINSIEENLTPLPEPV